MGVENLMDPSRIKWISSPGGQRYSYKQSGEICSQYK